VRLESGHQELGGGTEFLDLLGDTLAVLGVKGAVKLVHDVEWSGLYLLDSEDQASCNNCLLSSRETGEGKIVLL